MRGNSVNAQTCSVKTLSLKVGLPGWKRNSSELFPRPKNEERIRIIFLSHPPFLLLRIFLILASNPRASLRIAYVLQREKMESWKGYLVSAPFHLFDITFEISVPLYWVPNLDPVARARGGDDEEVELTQSPGTESWEKENCLGIGILLSRARRFLLFDARFAFHGLHPPFCREENHRGRAFFAMTRLPFEASPSSLALSREIVRIQLFHRPMEILEEEGETKQGREASKLMDSSRWGESTLQSDEEKKRNSVARFRGVRLIYWLAMCLSSRRGEDIFVNRALSDLIPRVESCSSVTLPFEPIEPANPRAFVNPIGRYFAMIS